MKKNALRALSRKNTIILLSVGLVLVGLNALLWHFSFGNEEMKVRLITSPWFPLVILILSVWVSFFFLITIRQNLLARNDFERLNLADEKLKENQDFLVTIINNLPVALFCKDNQNDLRFFLWNKKASEMWGLSQTQVIGKSDADLFPTEQAEYFRQKDLETLAEGQIVDISEEPVSTLNRGVIFVHTKKVPIMDRYGNPRYLLGISEDITEKKQTETLLETHRIKLAASAKLSALGEMAGGVAHEINTPLTIIHGMAARLRKLAGKGTLDIPSVIQTATDIETTAMRISTIVKGLRSFSRDAEKDPPQVTPIRTILSDALSLCQEKFRSHGLEFRLEPIPKDLTIECRPTQICQVLINLFANAYDAIEKESSKWIQVQVRDLEFGVEIAITDSGTGIPSEIWEKIFQPFYTTKEIGRGTGLGLSISKGIIESHKGSLSLDTSSEHTRFLIFLPKKLTQEANDPHNDSNNDPTSGTKVNAA